MHIQMSVRRHKDVPFLWRARCSCGAEFFAASEARAQSGLDHHIHEEEPFPDLGLAPDAKEEPGS